MGKIISKAIYPAFVLALLTVIFSCQKNVDKTTAANEEIATKAIPPKELKDFVQVNLVVIMMSIILHELIRNGEWLGNIFSYIRSAWVSAEGTGKSLVLNGDGTAVAISPVTIPPAGRYLQVTQPDRYLIQQLI